VTKETQAPRAPTVSHLLGEMTWLLTQSPLHRALAIGDLEWLVMPALLTEQFYIFRDGDRPVGLALWAKTDAAGERKLAGGLVDPANRLTLEEWSTGNRVWLVDLIAPFADENNRHLEVMMADLISGPLRQQEFRFHRVDAKTGVRETKLVPAGASEDLRQALAKAVATGSEGATVSPAAVG
jgi:cytolysin-activating lysine-acyltransferase